MFSIQEITQIDTVDNSKRDLEVNIAEITNTNTPAREKTTANPLFVQASNAPEKPKNTKTKIRV